MSLKQVVDFIDPTVNIAEKVLEMDDGETILQKLASQVIRDEARDRDSMSDWVDDVDEGRKLAKQETRSKSEPFEGAANFKSPAIMEASIIFGDKAKTEILRGKNLIKMEIIGKDENLTKKAAAKNVKEFMNWQINHEMRGWRESQKRLMYELPGPGTVFKKTFFDPIQKVNVSEKIRYPEFSVNQATTSIDKARSFTHLMDIPQNQVFERQASGLWLDVDIYPEDVDGDEGSNEKEEVVVADDNEQVFLEQYCFYDLDDDGYEEPYIVTVHKQSNQVVRIVARYDINDIYVRNSADSIDKLVKGQDLDDSELVRIDPMSCITKYGFIPATDGTFLDIGYFHILSGLSKGINSTTNQLLDSGSFANLQGGFLAKGFRKKMGNLKAKPGSWISTDISAQDLQSGVMPWAYKEPSQTLFALNQELKSEVDNLSVNVDLKGTIAPNAPATTTLALIQEAMHPMSSILQSVLDAEGEEFRLLFILNSKFASPLIYQTVLDDETADFENDFNLDAMNILPTANSEMSSRMQRLQVAEVLVSRVESLTLSGGDTRSIWEFWFDALGANEIKGKVFPDPAQVDEEQKARLEQQAKDEREQKLLQNIEIDQSERRLVVEENKAKGSVAKDMSTVALNLEKAESEDVKNRISTYTAEVQGVTAAISNISQEIQLDKDEAEDARRLSEQAIPVTPGAPNI